MDHESAEKKKN